MIFFESTRGVLGGVLGPYSGVTESGREVLETYPYTVLRNTVYGIRMAQCSLCFKKGRDPFETRTAVIEPFFLNLDVTLAADPAWLWMHPHVWVSEGGLVGFSFFTAGVGDRRR